MFSPGEVRGSGENYYGPTYLITNWIFFLQNSNQFLEIPRTILFHEIAVAFMLLRSCRSMVPSPFVGLLSILRRRFLTEQRTIFHLHDQTNFSLFSELISSIVIKIKMFALIWYTTEEMTISCFPIFLLNGTFTTNFTLQAWERNPQRETWWFCLFRSEATQLLNLHDKNKISTLVISLRDWSTHYCQSLTESVHRPHYVISPKTGDFPSSTAAGQAGGQRHNPADFGNRLQFGRNL